jgi:hypothetical protein
LEDRIHEAYALDNIHLAKVLYLKFQGIHVADDSDPRIKQVREEDFPFGTLTLASKPQRPVANAVLLRLRASRNVRAGEGVEWQGRARGGAVLSVAVL